MNIGLSGIGLLVVVVLVLVGWGIAWLMAWSPLLTITAVLGLMILVGGLQVWRALTRQRRLLREGRWPPDRPQGAA